MKKMLKALAAAGRINRNIVECKSVIHASFPASGFSINRNIVECKYHTAPLRPASERGINRNIVECKSPRPPCKKCIAYTVLIETLWNVNRNRRSRKQKTRRRINRNIVECK